jgi:hypothetical protein
VAQGVGPEFKPQYCKKKNPKNKKQFSFLFKELFFVYEIKNNYKVEGRI